MKQGSMQEVLVLTMRAPRLVTDGLPRHLGDCKMTIRETNVALLNDAALRHIADNITAHHRVVVDDCLQALRLHLILSHEHRDRLVAMTDGHPMHRPMPAVNLATGMANFNL